MRVLLLGAGGMLARDVATAAPDDATLVALDRAACDITAAAALSAAMHAHRPDWVLNAAAYTAVDRAESERALAMRVNGEAPGLIGAAAREVGARVLHPSTDYVFPGTGTTPWREDDATDPANWYGATKLAGEQALAASGAERLVVRVQWLFGTHGRSFPRTMWERAQAGQATRVVADQFGAPTSTRDLACALWHLMRAEARGTVHVASEGHGSWHDVAARVFAAAGRPELLTPCTSADYPTPAKRPGWSVFDLGRMRSLGVTMPRWEEAVEAFTAELARGGGPG